VKNTNIQTPSKAKPNKKPVFGDPALELVYRSWQRNRETAPELALKVVEAYAQAHRLSVRDLLRRFAEAEAWRPPRSLRRPQRPMEALRGRGGYCTTPPRFGGRYGPSEAGGGVPRQPRPGRDSRRATIYRRSSRGGYLGTTPRGGPSLSCPWASGTRGDPLSSRLLHAASAGHK
jgi:hypothetical protein